MAGPGSTWEIDTEMDLPEGDPGVWGLCARCSATGSSRVTVTQGGTILSAGEASIAAGDWSGSGGTTTVLVEGAGSTWDNSGCIHVETWYGGRSLLRVENGGNVNPISRHNIRGEINEVGAIRRTDLIDDQPRTISVDASEHPVDLGYCVEGLP